MIVESIDAAGVQLCANGTKKLRLFNVWATWCAPCVQEFPDSFPFREFRLRDFELITISTDRPAITTAAKSFLEKHGAGLPDHLSLR